jgi:hypothetical protein
MLLMVVMFSNVGTPAILMLPAGNVFFYGGFASTLLECGVFFFFSGLRFGLQPARH